MSMKMTMAEFVGLEPCPFCGGEAECHQWWSATISGKYATVCTKCNCGTDFYATEAEAIAAWNTRVDYHGYEQAAIEAWESIKAWNSRAERTCKPLGTIRYDYEGGYAGFEYKTELPCGHKWRDAYGDYPDYCPSCGCKVVGA